MRNDIQALRGLAVLLVVLYHADLFGLSAGFLGVDIFFIISGFLITGMIRKEVEAGSFEFSRFYIRRVRRLLPAAYVVIALTGLASMALLDSSELRNFAIQAIGAVTFTSNLVLWQQIGYFEASASLKPLLHMWSLSIEEQYYLIIPVALVLLPRKSWLPLAVLGVMLSFAGCIYFLFRDPEAAFYMLPTRAWELGIGSVAALLSAKKQQTLRIAFKPLFWPAVLVVMAVPGFGLGFPHPGIEALAVCLATVIIILCHDEAVASHFSVLILRKVGDVSYSLYLVHWPIFAFINNVYLDEPSVVVRFAACGVSLVLAVLLYRFIETPFRRHGDSNRKFVGGVALGSVGLLAFSSGVFATGVDDRGYEYLRRPNVGFDPSCAAFTDYVPLSVCRNSENPRIFIWGDSYAMHLVAGIVATTTVGVEQATRSVCGPFIDLSPMNDAVYSRAWAERCIKFNYAVYERLSKLPSVETVVLSSPFMQYLHRDYAVGGWRLLSRHGAEFKEQEVSWELAFETMRRTVEKIRSLGKKVVIVAPPPSSGFNIGRCLERVESGLPVVGGGANCFIRVEEYVASREPVIRLLKKIEADVVPVIFLSDYLCDEKLCATHFNGKFVYRDAGHFSYEGSTLVAEKIQLGELVQVSAR